MSETIPPSWPPPASPDPEDGPGPLGRGDEAPAGPSFGDRLAESKLLRMAVLLGLLAWAAMASMWLFVVIMALVVSIFLHEMGHYLMAKRNGMKVTEFFLGFGPRIWSFRRGETEYGLKVIPAGAYVKIIGMSNLEEVAPEDEARSYRAKSFGKRMPVVLGGPVMNLLLGFLLLVVVIAGFGKPSDTAWKVDGVTAGSAAEAAGLQSGDRVVAYNGQPITDFESFTDLVRGDSGANVELTIERDGQQIVLPATLGWALDEQGAAALGLNPSDRVTEVNGTPVASYADLVKVMGAAEGATQVTYVRERETRVHEVQGPVQLPQDGSKGLLGIGNGTVYEPVSILQAVPDAGAQFGEIVVGSVQGMGRIFSPSGIGNLFHLVTTARDEPTQDATLPTSDPGTSSSVTEPAAPSSSSSSSASASDNADRPLSILGIVNVASQAGEIGGWPAVLGILALVNIFLGLINLVPLLPFDGGHIAVACYEEIRTRISHRPYRVDMAKLMPVTYVVLVLMVGLFASTLYLDAVNPIKLN